jgi:hypothetical protein
LIQEGLYFLIRDMSGCVESRNRGLFDHSLMGFRIPVFPDFAEKSVNIVLGKDAFFTHD